MPHKRRKFESDTPRIDDRKGHWPRVASEARMETQALAERIKTLALRAEEALAIGSIAEVKTLLDLVYTKANDIEKIMKLVETGKWRG